MQAKGRFYPGWASRTEELCDHLRRTFEPEGYEVQVVTVEGGGRIFQMRTGHASKWKKVLSEVTGLANAVTVTMKPEGDGLTVTVGGGKWLEKAAVAGFATFVALGVLLIPAGIGMWKQKKLLTTVSSEIEDYVRGKSAGP